MQAVSHQLPPLAQPTLTHQRPPGKSKDPLSIPVQYLYSSCLLCTSHTCNGQPHILTTTTPSTLPPLAQASYTPGTDAPTASLPARPQTSADPSAASDNSHDTPQNLQ